MSEPSSLASTASTATMAGAGDKYNDSESKTIDIGLQSDKAVDNSLPKRPWRRTPTSWDRIINHSYKGTGTESDPFIVTWLPEDDENPMRYPVLYKWAITIMGTLSVTMGSSILSATMASIKHNFPDHNDMQYIMVTGIYILGFVLGPFLWGPGSEVFGRRMVYVVSLVPFVAFDSAVCGAKSLNALLMFRFFAGTFGCSTMTNAGGIISDMFEADQRGLAMGVFGAMPWLGPAIGPIVGGFLGTASSWRWVAAVAALFATAIAICHMLFLPETYHPILLRARAKRLSEATGKVYRSERDAIQPFDTKMLIITQLKVPYILLFTEPIVFILCLYMACVFGILYMQFTSFPLVFQGVRHWSPGISALAFLGTSVGCNLALAYMIWFGNPVYARQLKKDGYMAPETRLPSACVGAILMPIGLLVFAWTCVPANIPWIICILATVPFGAGMVLVFLASQNYLVDAYLPTAASVMAGATVVRSLIGVILPLFTVDMYNALGIRWASSLAGFIAVLFTPVPFLLLAYGRRIRRMTKHGRHADDRSIALAHERRTCCGDEDVNDNNDRNNNNNINSNTNITNTDKIEHSHLEEQDCGLNRVMSVP